MNGTNNKRVNTSPELAEPTMWVEWGHVLNNRWIMAALLFTACLFVYSPIGLRYKVVTENKNTWWDTIRSVQVVTTDYKFLWDDDQMVTGNMLIKQPDLQGLSDIWFTSKATDYFPLTNTAFWIQWRCWGDDPYGYHIVNIILHALATVMFWVVLRALKIPGAALGGLLFGLHPVCVSSVAWISELKNTLSMVPFLAAILFWVWHEDTQKKRWYALSLVMFVLSMLAKSSSVMFPVVLLLLAWWRRGKIGWWDVARSVPFFLVSLLLGLLTIWFQTEHSIAGVNVRPEGWASRLAASGWVVWFYLYKIFLPINLSMIYPRWVVGMTFLDFVPLLCLVVAFVVLFVNRRKWGHSPLAAAAYFVLTLAPVLGFITMSFSKHSFVADHWQYVSMISIIALATGGAVLLWRRLKASPVLGLVVATAVVGILSMTTWMKIQTFEDVESVCRDTLKNYPQIAFAHNNLGYVLAQKKRMDEAFEQFKLAIQLKLDYDDAENNVGVLMSQMGNFAEAEKHFRRTLEINPRFGIVYPALYQLYLTQGKYAEAKQLYLDALKVDPGNYMYRVVLGWLLATCNEDKIRDGALAVKLAQEACEMSKYGDPRSLDALAAGYAEIGNYSDAVKTMAQAIVVFDAALSKLRDDAAKVGEQAAAMVRENEKVLREFRSRQDIYRENRPFRSSR